jgi:membrane protease YdiL (CAAX protease family)
VALASPIALRPDASPSGVASNLGINYLVNVLFLFGEEFGWRSYLQDRVVSALGVARGLLVMSLVWSLRPW